MPQANSVTAAATTAAKDTPAALFAPRPPALLALADGTVFRGTSIGAQGSTCGEVVFNTAMSGYQEILTDPSYAGQIVTLTYPHIGNVGVNLEDVESRKVFVSGLVIRDLPRRMSNFRASQDLSAYLRDAGIVAIADIDTRKLTRILRERGAQRARGERRARARPVRELDALAGAGDHHGVLADDVAAAQRGEADRAGLALAGHAFAGVDRVRV